MTETARPWINAAIELGRNPERVVKCPECKTGILQVKDELRPDFKTDRYLICNNCGQHNVISGLVPTGI